MSTTTEAPQPAFAGYGIEGAEPVRDAIAALLPAGTPPGAVLATIRLMRRRWLELYGDDPFFAED